MFTIDTNEQSEIIDKLSSYYQFRAARSKITTPIWSEPYTDFSGFGRLFTVTLPIHYEEGNKSFFLGVAGLDIPSSSFNISEEEIIEKLHPTTDYCPGYEFTDCEI